MDLSWDQQRLDSSYRLLTNEFKTSKVRSQRLLFSNYQILESYEIYKLI